MPIDRAVVGPALVAILCGAAIIHAELNPAPRTELPRPGEPTAAARSILGDLEVGSKVAGWTVLGIRGPTDGEIRIDFAHGQVQFSVMVTRMGMNEAQPPMQTDVYALYYGHAVPKDTRIPGGAVRAILANLARRIRKTEHSVPVPAGM